jgi:hypothetical protein
LNVITVIRPDYRPTRVIKLNDQYNLDLGLCSDVLNYDYLKMQHNKQSMRIGLLIPVAIGAVAVTIAVMLFLSLTTIFAKEYAIDIDAMKDSQNLFSTARVTISNVGKLPLTNIIISYGGNNSTNEKITLLPPGEKVLMSPPNNIPLKSVTVQTDQGLKVTKQYRTPIKLPGMMGS